jgi:hypothetical protein
MAAALDAARSRPASKGRFSEDGWACGVIVRAGGICGVMVRPGGGTWGVMFRPAGGICGVIVLPGGGILAGGARLLLLLLLLPSYGLGERVRMGGCR